MTSNIFLPLASTENNTKLGLTTYSSKFASFNGGIDDVRIYDRVLSLAEIQALYSQGK